MTWRDAHEQNRRSWNAVTPVHNSHKGDQAAFFRAGGTTLFPEDHDLLGDVRGREIVHLQCNCGQDTLSIARLGAARLVGVDISDAAIEFAQTLSADSGIPAEFVRSDLYDWLETTEERFDVVYTSYGALPWLSDIARWGRGVGRILRPGGRLVALEFHPAMWMFDPQWKRAYPYSTHGQPFEDGTGIDDYVAESAGGLWPEGLAPEGAKGWKNPHPVVSFPWGVGEVVSAVIGGGLTLRRLEEYPYSNGCKPFEQMGEREGRRWTAPEGTPEVPMMFGIVATR